MYVDKSKKDCKKLILFLKLKVKSRRIKKIKLR